jgi:hypothetical protein
LQVLTLFFDSIKTYTLQAAYQSNIVRKELCISLLPAFKKMSSSGYYDMELTALHKRLGGSWSAWTASTSLSNPVLIDEVRHNFFKFEKKIKMRILLALLGIGTDKRNECNSAISKLLKAASDDTTDPWIPITAGLVHLSLFGGNGKETIEAQALSKVDDSITQILDRVETMGDSDIVQSSQYYQPLEMKYLGSGQLVEDTSGTSHFTTTLSCPDFLGREKKNYEARQKATQPSKVLEALNKKYVPAQDDLYGDHGGIGMPSSHARYSMARQSLQMGQARTKKEMKTLSIHELKAMNESNLHGTKRSGQSDDSERGGHKQSRSSGDPSI